MSIRLSRRAALISSAVGAAGAALPATGWAQTSADTRSDDEIAAAADAWVRRCMAAWPDQPAVSLALVRDGKTVLAKGYGVRRQGKNEPADEHTLFAIASNSKNVTAACLAILVDEGKVKWDEPIRTYLPGFTLSDPMVGERITVRDTLSHRAGFGLGAGDLLFWPNSDRTRAEVLAQAAFVPIEDGFREDYHYCNLMFVVAGAVIEKVSGLSWEAFVQTRIFDRVGMSESVPLARLADPKKSALPHGRVGPPLRYQGAMTQIAESIVEVWNWDSAAAAGGICASAHDWAKWIAVRLNDGKLADGSRLFSEAAAKEMYKPNIVVSSSNGPTAALPNRAVASTYAMGLQVQDYRGERLATHGGGSPGGISATVLIPGRKIGFSVFTNAEESFLLRALRSGLSDIAMNKVDVDWIADSKRIEAEGTEKSLKAAVEIDAKQAAGAAPSLPLEAYAGTWRDPWYGDIVIEPRTEGRGRNRKSGLWLRFTHTPALQGWLEPYDGETFRTRFPDKREEDAFITFSIATAKPATATVKGVSPDIDFSYDYQDLRLTRV
ncbi:serine hydrolase [Brevundimonas diminuta]|jgi:CubicO group peptidase (beta-lactamase class C family)|uniref:Serine hydrolase n=1 Tax=Brevundimonas diminuta TaxID=293 RepID=A0A410NT59_BREDI|nr:serine hydrolase [Brevundimonas diminuta]MBD3571505.1 serine hydrolase [Brevundimonas diminuta]QAT13174.1 serine hydrolase [Brevundimonas diminuta]QQB89474.1 serine hydrolase [Brevundimonas diminuta]GEC01941.1 serine hydrolase [Brevundimonas diminuta]